MILSTGPSPIILVLMGRLENKALDYECKKGTSGHPFPLLHSHKAIIVKYADRLSNLVRVVDWPSDWQEGYLKNSIFWKTEPGKKE